MNTCGDSVENSSFRVVIKADSSDSLRLLRYWIIQGPMKPLITWLHFVKMGQILDLIFREFRQVVNCMILGQSPG